MGQMCSTAQELARPTIMRNIAGKSKDDPDSKCKIWTGRVTKDGYGEARVTIAGKLRTMGAHRAAWISDHGSIPDGLTIDHLCFNKACVNTKHLEPVTIEENFRRAVEAGIVGRPKGKTPLEDRRGCREHGKSEGYWQDRKDGYTAWVCNPCTALRQLKFRSK